ncbi:MAG: hypothetical protein NTX25_04965 [Proteobacteria bacterium]|nr:hypothetical protein [Pseudomonadota bacterium]
MTRLLKCFPMLALVACGVTQSQNQQSESAEQGTMTAQIDESINVELAAMQATSSCFNQLKLEIKLANQSQTSVKWSTKNPTPFVKNANNQSCVSASTLSPITVTNYVMAKASSKSWTKTVDARACGNAINFGSGIAVEASSAYCQFP